MNVQIEESWKTHLQPEFEKDYFRTLTEFVKVNIASIRFSLRENLFSTPSTSVLSTK